MRKVSCLLWVFGRFVATCSGRKEGLRLVLKGIRIYNGIKELKNYE